MARVQLQRPLQLLTVADAMITSPAVHRPWTTVGELCEFFEDDHVHLALIVYAGKLLGTVERADLPNAGDDRTAALAIAKLDGRTIAPRTPLAEARAALRRSGRRRLAVTGDDSTVLGLLCLKANGRGFCTDDDVAARHGPGRNRTSARSFEGCRSVL